MPTFTYPGVYIEELSSGVHSITGVATSIAAFIGWAPQGPVTEATLVESWSDYQAQFGGLDARSKLGYSVNQFFTNGGTQAYIVRLVWDGTLPPAPSTNPSPCATAVAAGVGSATATITASVGAIVSPPITISIGAPVLQSIVIGPASTPPIPLGSTITLVATGLSSNGVKTALAGATWTSSNIGVVAVTSTGAATGMSPGTATLTATSGLISGTIAVTVYPSALKSITVTPAGLTLPVGQAQPPAGQPPLGPTQQLAATATYFDGTTQNVTAIATWSTPAGSDSTVTSTGLAIAGTTAGSTTTISAAWAGMTGTTVVTVGAAAAVTAITIQQAAPVATVGMPVNFTAVALSTDSATPAAVTGTWTSSNPAVATIVTATGVATAVAPGSTTITVTDGSISASTTLTVTAAVLNAISITPINPSVAQNLTLQLKATGSYSDGTNADLTGSADWTSGGGDATVNEHTGVVTGVNVDAAGAPITATWHTVVAGVVTVVSSSTKVVVSGPVLQSIAITPAGAMLSSGGTLQLKATGTYSAGPTQDLTTTATWASSAPTIVSVNATGLAAAMASGGSLTLFAANPGAWGNNLRVTITPQSSDPTRFGILVQQITSTGQLQTLESFVSLSILATDPSYVVTVIDNDSNYLSFINPATKSAGDTNGDAFAHPVRAHRSHSTAARTERSWCRPRIRTLSWRSFRIPLQVYFF
jgi:hypothetical protein